MANKTNGMNNKLSYIVKNVLSIVMVAAVLVSCNKSAKVSGAGATFPAPFYNIVFKDFTKETGIAVNYGAIGSGGGIRSLKDKTVDFGATDVFLSDAELAEMGAEVVHIPTVLGAIVLSYNLPGVDNLNLNSSLITDIYLGKITNWNDPKIKELNPNVNFPDKNITPIYRSDGSGTTAVFSEYMSKTNPEWESAIGAGKSLKFPQGIAAKGNPGIAGIVAETEGAIGYIGSEYALALNLKSAALQNSSNQFVQADAKSISAAADIDMPNDTRAIITNSPNPAAYPISTFTWIIVYKNQNYNGRTQEDAKALKELLSYIISSKAQSTAEKTHYAQLPESVSAKAKAIVESINFENQAAK